MRARPGCQEWTVLESGQSLLPPADHGLGLEELLETVVAPLAAVARLLVAAERRAEVGRCPVDADLAGADPRRDAARALEVARRHVAGEAVRRVVGDPDRIVLVVVGQDREHGPEDLLARD